MTVVPSGATHEVGVEELFFSTTDERGVIRQANDVFVRIARHPREALLGAPHNIIRHPATPAGLFRIIWDSIQAGRPVSAYVRNLAGDGSAYWTFAAVSPADGGYLSIRTRPVEHDLHALADMIYREVRPRELAARHRGASAADAADLGRRLIEARLRESGFASYDEFSTHALLAETSTRRDLAAPHPERGTATGVMRMMPDAVGGIRTEVERLADALNASDAAAGRLLHLVERAARNIQTIREALARATAGGEAHLLLSHAAGALDSQLDEVSDGLRVVTEQARATLRQRYELRSSVGTCLLGGDMVAHYVASIIDGDEQIGESTEAVRMLVRALQRTIDMVGRDSANDSETMVALSERAREAEQTALKTMPLLNRWRVLVESHAAGLLSAQELSMVDEALRSVGADVTAVDDTAQQLWSSAMGFDAAELEARLMLTEMYLDAQVR